MGIFSWEPFNGGGAVISKYITGHRCDSTSLVAYHILDKHSMAKKLEFEGDYIHLKNNFGIYFLMGEGVNGIPTIYVGQASTRQEYEQYNNLKGMDRLREHLYSEIETYRDDWESALFITSEKNDWDSAMLNTLERLFIATFKTNKNYRCLNRKNGQDGNISVSKYKTNALRQI